jgi:hypothetical protein
MDLKNVSLKQFSVQSPHHNALRESQMERKATGRPSKYTEALVAEICDRVANGTPLREICREDDKPTWSTFYDWLCKNPDLSARFARSRELGTDAIAEDALAIIDAIPERLEGGRMDSAYVQWQKNRVEMRLKLLAKWNPKKYGDRQILAGDVEAPLVMTGDSPLMAAIKNIEMSLQARNADDDSK